MTGHSNRNKNKQKTEQISNKYKAKYQNYSISKPRCLDSTMKTTNNKSKWYVYSKAQKLYYRKPWNMQCSWSIRQLLQNGLHDYVRGLESGNDQIPKENLWKHKQTIEWNEENSSRLTHGKRIKNETNTVGKLESKTVIQTGNSEVALLYHIRDGRKNFSHWRPERRNGYHGQSEC